MVHIGKSICHVCDLDIGINGADRVRVCDSFGISENNFVRIAVVKANVVINVIESINALPRIISTLILQGIITDLIPGESFLKSLVVGVLLAGRPPSCAYVAIP